MVACKGRVLLGTKHTLVTATPDTTSIVYGMQNRAVQGPFDSESMAKGLKLPALYHIYSMYTMYIRYTLCTESTLYTTCIYIYMC